MIDQGFNGFDSEFSKRLRLLAAEMEDVRTADRPGVAPVFNANTMFGLRTTNTAAQNDTALAAAKAALPASGGIIYIDPGSYSISAKFTLSQSHTWLIGSKRLNTSFVWAGAADTYMLEIDNASYCGVADLQLDCDDTANGIALNATTGTNQSNILRDLRIRKPRIGIAANSTGSGDPQVDDWEAHNIRIEASIAPNSSLAKGYLIDSANSTGRIIGGKITGYDDNGAGVHIADNLALHLQDVIFAGQSPATGTAAIRIVGPHRMVTMTACYEENTVRFLELTSAAPGELAPITITGCTINHEIFLDKATRLVTLGNHFNSSGGTPMVTLDTGGCIWVDVGSHFDNASELSDYVSMTGISKVHLLGTSISATLNVTLSNGDNNNVLMPDGETVRLIGPTGAYAITGMQGGIEGRRMRLISTVPQALTIKNENASSTDVNRIVTSTGADIVPGNAAIVQLEYLASRWRVISARGSAGVV